jgi:hypothetical protein
MINSSDIASEAPGVGNTCRLTMTKQEEITDFHQLRIVLAYMLVEIILALLP